MSSLSDAAGIRIVDEFGIEIPVQFLIYQVMQKPVAHRRLVNVAGLWIGYVEGDVSAMSIHFFRDIAMQGKEIVHKPRLEQDHICPFALAV